MPFHPDTGADQSVNAFVRHHIDYFSDFSSGVYDAGDLTFQNYTCYESLKCFYAKTYRRGLNSGPLVDGAIWKAGAQANQLPGGSGLVELRNVQFESPSMALNHHCALGGEPTGGICASHYWIRDPVGTYASSLQFQDETYSADAGGHRSNLIIEYDSMTWFLPDAHVTFSTSTCDRTTEPVIAGAAGTYWVRCPQEWGIRIVRLYSPNRGNLVVNSGSVSYQIPPFSVTINPGIGGFEAYSPPGRTHAAGYSFLVRNDADLDIDVLTRVEDDLFVVEYSENTWPAEKATRILLTVTETYSNGAGIGFGGGPIYIHSNHSRDFITPYGAILPQAGAWWAATGGWPTTYDAATYDSERIAMLIGKGVDSSKAGGPVITRSIAVSPYATGEAPLYPPLNPGSGLRTVSYTAQAGLTS